MNIACGIDLIYLPRFKKSLKNGGENFLRRIYHEQELIKTDTAHLAGIFAAKEAVIKALSLPTNSWHDILISYQSNGAPKVQLSNVKSQLSSVALSISHDGNYVIAQFTAIYE
jgi:phosphopantetheine--protein transferase-like protein